MKINSPANVLVFSGLDPSGGAGVQADIETISSLGATACSIITALTVQDTKSVQGYRDIDAKFIEQQARCILNDIPIQCFKIGMIANEDIILCISEIMSDYPDIPVVIDPILSAGGGGDLSNNTTYTRLKTELIPLATIVTPNSLEARALASDKSSLAECAESLLQTGCLSVLITGEHEQSTEVSNTFYTDKQVIVNNWPRLADQFHGSGCTLSASIAAFLALGHELQFAMYKAQQYTYNTLLNAKTIGHGQLIPNRFYSSDKN